MSIEVINLCSDEEIDEKENKAGIGSFLVHENGRSEITSGQSECSDNITKETFDNLSSTDLVKNISCYNVSYKPNSVPLCRQFWKVGDHEARSSFQTTSKNGKNRLRVHPKFLHSNATSHKWAFGAIAELLDNAVDEAQYCATFVKIDRIAMPYGDYALLIEDNGRGMDPESLRRCMSFGFSDKQSDSCIGQYGNGFKTSSMRLGADVIVFSRSMHGREITQSVGILSYTSLRITESDDIIVPMVDYKLDPLTREFKRLLRNNETQFQSNLSTLLRWSPFSTEVDLVGQFNSIGNHGTKILIFNLWLNDAGYMELDFHSDSQDIIITRAPNPEKMSTCGSHIANLLRCSLRVYSSILYLHLPSNFKIILRGEVVEPHNLVNDLKYRQCIKYKPQVASREFEVVTTIGYLKDAPHVNVHGFNVYHKNRLILPFWPVCAHGNNKGRGVAGVLEANFIKPTHDKQDFEKSNIFLKLETRLKEMTIEYWNFHCHLVGYKVKKVRYDPNYVPNCRMDRREICDEIHLMVNDHLGEPSNQLPDTGGQSAKVSAELYLGKYSESSVASGSQLPQDKSSHVLADANTMTAKNTLNDLSGPPLKRARELDEVATEAVEAISGENANIKLMQNKDGKKLQEIAIILQENKELHRMCKEYEKMEKGLLCKVQLLTDELQEIRRAQDILIAELQ